jgi:hypothetical protein
MAKIFDPTKPVQTRDGRKARIICTNRTERLGYPIVALIFEQNDIERIETFSVKGETLQGCPHSNDLVNVPIKKSGWINVYADGTSYGVHATQNVADILVADGTKRVACIPIEWEE